MTEQDRTQVAQIERQLEETWQLMDELFDNISADDWHRPHGTDWTFADLPWHLSYIDREIVFKPAKAGPDLPEAERLDFGSVAELNAWNDAMIASRPAGQTVEQSMEQMRQIRDECRQMVAGMNDSDLEETAWFPLLFNRGWRTKIVPLNFCVGHAFGHFMEARGRLKRNTTEPSPELVHAQLEGLMGFIQLGINKEIAQQTDLTLVMNFTGSGGGAWTIDIDHGQIDVTEKYDPDAQFVMTASPNTFYLMSASVINPVMAMLTRKIKIKGLRHMGAFGKLTAPPPLDTIIEPAP